MRDHEHTNGNRPNMAHRGFIVAAGALLASASTTASAQTPPPPGYQPVPVAVAPQAAPGMAPQPYPPGAYGQAPPGYGPPPVYYTAPPGGYEASMPGPRVLDWEQGQPLQPGYHAETRIRRGLVAAGAATFGGSYLPTALAGAIITDSRQTGFEPLFVPVVGPFITIGTAHASSTGAFILVIDGLAQSAGVAMFVIGLALPKTMQVRNDMARPSVHAVPMTFGASSGGMGLVGRF